MRCNINHVVMHVCLQETKTKSLAFWGEGKETSCMEKLQEIVNVNICDYKCLCVSELKYFRI